MGSPSSSGRLMGNQKCINRSIVSVLWRVSSMNWRTRASSLNGILLFYGHFRMARYCRNVLLNLDYKGP